MPWVLGALRPGRKHCLSPWSIVKGAAPLARETEAGELPRRLRKPLGNPPAPAAPGSTAWQRPCRASSQQPGAGRQARGGPDAALGARTPGARSGLQSGVSASGLRHLPPSHGPHRRRPRTVLASIVFTTLQNVSSVTAQGPRPAGLARAPSLRPGPAAPTRRPENATKPGGQGGGRPGRGRERRPPAGPQGHQAEGDARVAPAAAPGAARGHGHPALAQSPAAPGVAPARRPSTWTAPAAAPLP